jgi:hypothetical protein
MPVWRSIRRLRSGRKGSLWGFRLLARLRVHASQRVGLRLRRQRRGPRSGQHTLNALNVYLKNIIMIITLCMLSINGEEAHELSGLTKNFKVYTFSISTSIYSSSAVISYYLCWLNMLMGLRQIT